MSDADSPGFVGICPPIQKDDVKRFARLEACFLFVAVRIFSYRSTNSDESTLQDTRIKISRGLLKKLNFSDKTACSSRSARAQSTESRDVHTQRTMAEEEDRSPKRARGNPEVPRKQAEDKGSR